MQEFTKKTSHFTESLKFHAKEFSRFSAMKFAPVAQFLTMTGAIASSFVISVPKSYRDFKRTIGLLYASFGFWTPESGQTIEDIPGYAVIIGVVAIVAGLTQKILSGMKAGEESTKVNASLDKGITAIDTIVDWLDEISLVLMAVVILLLVLYIHQVVKQGSGGSGGMYS